MDDRKLQAATEAAKRRQVGRRVKRGVVAGYIHEISARHQVAAAHAPERREPAFATAPQD